MTCETGNQLTGARLRAASRHQRPLGQARLRDLLEAPVELVLQLGRDLSRFTHLPHLIFDLRDDLGGHPATAAAEPDTGDEESPIRSGNDTNPVAPPGFTTSKVAAGSRRA